MFCHRQLGGMLGGHRDDLRACVGIGDVDGELMSAFVYDDLVCFIWREMEHRWKEQIEMKVSHR
jgi:hypothetical protein